MKNGPGAVALEPSNRDRFATPFGSSKETLTERHYTFGWLLPFAGRCECWAPLPRVALPLLHVFSRSMLRALRSAAKARHDGLGRRFACYLHQVFCAMLPGCKVLGPSKQDLIRAIR